MSGLLLAAGLIDESPKVEGLGSAVYDAQSGSARSAMASKRWIAASAFWALPMKAEGALLRTYSRHVMLFEKEKNSEAMRETLSHGRTQSTDTAAAQGRARGADPSWAVCAEPDSGEPGRM
jgi:hypothetical protein